MNDSNQPDGLVLSLLVFGVLPRPLSAALRKFSTNTAHILAMAAARQEYDELVSQDRVDFGLRKPLPNAQSTLCNLACSCT